MNMSERWFRLLLRLYPTDFRDEMGAAVVEAYLSRSRETSIARVSFMTGGVPFTIWRCSA